jgi:predicted AAA+ superfamily ATPase
MIHRSQQNYLDTSFFKGKAILICGARQVGKTAISKHTVKNHSFLWLNGDELATQHLLKNITPDKLKAIIGKHKILVIDEAQLIHNIGLLIKRMVDNFPAI